jgi:hypothetical protein
MKHNQTVNLEIFFDRILQSWKVSLETSIVLIGSIEGAINRQIPEARSNYEKMKKYYQELQHAAINPNVVIATTGTTSSGKSTIANVLIGEDLLPKAVQEMSAGIVKIIHNEKIKKLIIEKTRGAAWEVGEWDNIEAAEIRKKLKYSMECYRDLIQEKQPSECLDIEPPSSIIYWPTNLGMRSNKFNLPKNVNLSILDLPGLKYINDDINGNVIRSQVKKAFCIVAYNSFETNPTTQEKLLREIIDQVKKLGGSPARMLFLLNRIDAFLNDDDPDVSVQKFYNSLLKNIKNNLSKDLQEFAQDIEKIDPILFSSEPALFVSMAEKNLNSINKDVFYEYLNRLNKFYRPLINDNVIENYSGSVKLFDERQVSYFMNRARKVSRIDIFEDRLAIHVKENLPELLFPDLIDNIRNPSQKIISSLDGIIETSCLSHKEDLKKSREQLEKANQLLSKEKEKLLNILTPLRTLSKTTDLGLALVQASNEVTKRADNYDKNLNFPLLALADSLQEAVEKPLNRLLSFVHAEFSNEVAQDPYVESIGVTELRRNIKMLLESPYGTIASTGGDLSEKEADLAYEKLKTFAVSLSDVAMKLIKQESSQQCERIEQILIKCQKMITKKLGDNAVELLKSSGTSFHGLRYVFDYPISLSSLILPNLFFEVRPEKWQRQWVEYEHKTKTTQQRKWYTLWLYKHEVEVTETVSIQKSAKGYKFDSFKSMLTGFGRSANTNDLEDIFRTWLWNGLNKFDQDLQKGLSQGVDEYRRYLLERESEIEKNTNDKIANLEQYREKLKEFEKLIHKASDWRRLNLGEF